LRRSPAEPQSSPDGRGVGAEAVVKPSQMFDVTVLDALESARRYCERAYNHTYSSVIHAILFNLLLQHLSRQTLVTFFSLIHFLMLFRS